MTWIEPLELGTWLVNVFSGDLFIFTAISLLVITSMASYFRMNGLNLIIILLIFLTMFNNWIDQSIYLLFISIGGILLGFWVKKIITN